MAHDPKVRNQLRAKYLQVMPLTTAADVCKVSYQTARNWKRAAKEAGDDWDISRAAQRMSRTNIDNMTSQVVEEMSMQFLATLEELKNNQKLQPVQKADILARLSDSFIKTVNAAGRSNPKLATLSICMDVLRDFASFVQAKYPKEHARFIAYLEEFGQEVAKKYS